MLEKARDRRRGHSGAAPLPPAAINGSRPRTELIAVEIGIGKILWSCFGSAFEK